ncbi:hypothetical protein [Devosia sp.]|uniref:hypothetical protein n=1 Tax=Devosia sp. TaxID=1871048 RepID=UPI002AFEFAD0|nr:hypothetical protein [Devosia sp.]
MPVPIGSPLNAHYPVASIVSSARSRDGLVDKGINVRRVPLAFFQHMNDAIGQFRLTPFPFERDAIRCAEFGIKSARCEHTQGHSLSEIGKPSPEYRRRPPGKTLVQILEKLAFVHLSGWP